MDGQEQSEEGRCVPKGLWLRGSWRVKFKSPYLPAGSFFLSLHQNSFVKLQFDTVPGAI